MKAIRLLKEYQNIDFGCDMSTHIKDCDEAIAELEALENKTCEGCKHEKEKINLSKYNCNPYPCYECLRNACDRWEEKL